jgi:hypothetical protein
MSDNLFNAELHDADRYNEIQEQRDTYDDYADELDEHDLQIAQAHWEAEQHEAEWDAANDECEQADIDAGWVTPATKEEVSEWLAEQDAPFGFMTQDDPDYWV